MLKNISLKYFIFIGFLLTGCNEFLDPKDFEIQSFPVVLGFLSPESEQTTIHVSKAAAFNDLLDSTASKLLITNARVQIKNDRNQSAVLHYDSLMQRYVVDSAVYPIQHERTYFLEVTLGNEILSAYCKIPARLHPVTTRLEQNGVDHFIQAAWLDPVQTVNFYRLKGFYERSLGRFPISYEISWNSNCQKKASLLTDVFVEGKRMESPWGNISNVACNGFNSVDKGDKIHLEVLSTDESYYKYHKSVFAALERARLSDPVTIYSNIKNGQGIFAGFTSNIQTVTF